MWRVSRNHTSYTTKLLVSQEKIYAPGEGRHRAAIVVINDQIDSLLLRQLSDEDTVVLEVLSDKAKTIVASMYLDINRQIEDDLNKIDAVIQHAKGAGVLLAIDSNSRSKMWHDNQTNARGKILEEFLTSKQLHILKEESTLTTYLSSRGSSNIDLTVVSNQLLRAVENWEVSDQESCSDHCIIKFAVGQASRSCKIESQRVRYLVNSDDIDKFQGNLTRLLEERLNTTNTDGGSDDLDATLSEITNKGTKIEKLIE